MKRGLGKRDLDRKFYFLILFLGIVALAFIYLNYPNVDIFRINANYLPGIMEFVIYQSQPNSSVGNDNYIREGNNNSIPIAQTMRIGKTGGALAYRSLIKFDLSSISSGDTVTSGKMQVFLNLSTNNNNMTIIAYRVTSPWNRTEVSWSNGTSTSIWNNAGGDYAEEVAYVIFTNQTTYYNFTITNVARGWINGTYANYGLLLLSNDSGNDWKEISTSNSTNENVRPTIFVDHVANAPPSILNISVNSNATNPKKVGDIITFNVSWMDLEGNNVQAYVCNSSNISFNYGCGDRNFCNTSLSSTNPIFCNYTAQSSDIFNSSFWVAVCDSSNCSEVSNRSFFYVNHAPSVLLVQPNGGEIVNQSLGNYAIKFNVSDADSDLLNGSIYYGLTQNSTTYLINSSLNLTKYCTDADSKISTANNCTYMWNTTGIYGNYYLTIVANDTFNLGGVATSDSSFSVVSVIDNQNPNITAQWIEEGGIYSGKKIQIYANVSDPHIKAVWFSVNTTPQQNRTMLNSSDILYNGTFTAPQVGTYKFKVYANDTLGNINDSMPYVEFNVTKPNATIQSVSSPSSASPYTTIRISSDFNASDGVTGVTAYLNVPDGFIFLSGYPQQTTALSYSVNQTRTSDWFVATPLIQSNYTLNITYADAYSNVWNSSNVYVSVNYSATGGGGNGTGNSYSINLAGYPEVETLKPYFVQASFKNNGINENADGASVLIYDALGSLVVGPSSMSNPSTGVYNYTYTVGASAAEGLWQTIVNVTKGSTQYYSNQFWKVVGGPFDVRDIEIINSDISALNISVVAENKGATIKDLTLSWNLTRVDNGALLDSRSNTFAVEGYEILTKYINPTTTYVGQVKITFLGQYSGTEKAGAYRIFSTTTNVTPTPTPIPSGGGGGGGGITEKADFEVLNLQKEIKMTKNLEKEITFEVKNNGTKTLNNIIVILKNLEGYYNLSPSSIKSIKPGNSGIFKIKFMVTDFIGEREFNYVVKTDERTKNFSAKINVMAISDFIKSKIADLKFRVELVKNQTSDEFIINGIKICEGIINEAEKSLNAEEYINANDKINESEECVKNVENELIKKNEVIFTLPPIIGDSWKWIITWILILFLIIVLIAIIYLLYRKLNVINFLKQENEKRQPPSKSPEIKKEYFDRKIKDIKKKLNLTDSEDITEA